MKQSGNRAVLRAAVPVLPVHTFSAEVYAARLFDALRFWFFGFIFTRSPFRMKRFA